MKPEENHVVPHWGVPRNAQRNGEAFWCRNRSQYPDAHKRAARSNAVSTMYLLDGKSSAIIGRMNLYSPASVLEANGSQPLRVTRRSFDPVTNSWKIVDGYTENGINIRIPPRLLQLVYRGDLNIFDPTHRNNGMGTKLVAEGISIFYACHYSPPTERGHKSSTVGITTSPAVTRIIEKLGGYVDAGIKIFQPTAPKSTINQTPHTIHSISISAHYPRGDTRVPMTESFDDLILFQDQLTQIITGMLLPETRVRLFDPYKEWPHQGQIVGFINPDLTSALQIATATAMRPFFDSHRWASLILIEHSPEEIPGYSISNMTANVLDIT